MDWVIYIMWQGQGGSSIEEGGDVDVYVTINNRQGGSPGCPSREQGSNPGQIIRIIVFGDDSDGGGIVDGFVERKGEDSWLVMVVWASQN